MRLAALSDIHLGYRAYNTLAPSGANQRSVDVALAFRAAVDGMLATNPAIVLCGGDLFHEPKPSNTAILFAFAQFERLQAAGIPVVLVAGNHDSPRQAETGCILRLFEKCCVAVATDEARQFVYPALDLRVVAVPHQAVMAGEVPASEGTEKYQVLLAHAEAQGVYRKGADRVSGQLPPEVLNDPRWSFVALGDYHKMHRVAPRVWYSGSTEFTSSNPWEEIDTPKGWLLIDCDSGDVEPQLIPTRAVYDLPAIDAAGLTAEDVSALISERIGSVDVSGALVRLIVRDIPRHLSRALDHAAIRAAKSRALDFKLDLRTPARVVSPVELAVARGKPLDQIVAEWFRSWPLTPGLDRDRFVALGTELMDEAAEIEAERLAKRGAA